MSEQSNTQYGLTVKEATSRVYPFIEGMNLVMKILDHLNMNGVATIEDLEARLASTSERPDLIVDKALLNAFDSWCKGEGIDDAESFTSKVDEWDSLEGYRENVQSELETIASAIDNIEGL